MRRFLLVSLLALVTVSIVPFAHAESTVVPSCTPGVGASGCGTGYSCDKNKNACIPNSVFEGNQPFSYIVRSPGCFAQVDCAQFGSAYACDLSINTCVPAGDVSPQAGTPGGSCPNGTFANGVCVGNAANGLPPGTTATGNILNNTNAGSQPGSSGGLNLTQLQGYENTILALINGIFVPILLAIAFLVFIWGVFNAYIWERGAQEVASGHQLILWSLVGFAVIFSVWGLVNVIVGVFNFAPGGSAASHGLSTPTL